MSVLCLSYRHAAFSMEVLHTHFLMAVESLSARWFHFSHRFLPSVPAIRILMLIPRLRISSCHLISVFQIFFCFCIINKTTCYHCLSCHPFELFCPSQFVFLCMYYDTHFPHLTLNHLNLQFVSVAPTNNTWNCIC